MSPVQRRPEETRDREAAPSPVPGLAAPDGEIEAELARELDRLATAGLRRRLTVRAGAPKTVAFCSNDYLDLARHPALAWASAEAAAALGVGAGSARLVSGNLAEHGLLEGELAAFLGTPAALLFPTGYQANLGVLGALASREDLVVSDAANHASLIDGCRLSRAQVAVYPHRDRAAARALLATPGPYRRRFLVTESLFSMDGDLAPLADLATIAASARSHLIVDEAHALGVLGPGGTGLCRAAGVSPLVTVGTLGKAFGTQGGFAAGSQAVVDTLLNRARTFVFTTAPSPPVVAAARAALVIVRGPEGDHRRAALETNLALLHEGLADTRANPTNGADGGGPSSPVSPILPVILGLPAAAVAASEALLAHGFWVPPIRPPTVPEGTARLRVTLSAGHTPDAVGALARVLAPLLR